MRRQKSPFQTRIKCGALPLKGTTMIDNGRGKVRTVFHGTSVAAAPSILAGGFKSRTGFVWVSAEPVTPCMSYGRSAEACVAIDVPEGTNMLRFLPFLLPRHLLPDNAWTVRRQRLEKEGTVTPRPKWVYAVPVEIVNTWPRRMQ
jgi:hypothetical protein